MKSSSIAKKFNLISIGNDIEINGVSSTSHPNENTIVLMSSIEKLHTKCDNLVVLTSKKICIELGIENALIAENPRVAFAKITSLFYSSPVFNIPFSDNNSSNFENKNISYGENVSLGKNVVIENDVVIGNNVKIGHNTVIHKNCVIGDDVVIDSGTIIGSEGFGNVLDNNGKWQHIFHSGKVIIKNNVSIGANCTIDRGTIDDTIIESGVIIDNLVHIAHNVYIGENTAIAAKVGIAGSCKIGKRNMIGGMVGIVDHIVTNDDVIISATSTVNKDLKEPGTYTGIMPISKHTIWKRIALWITKLDKIAKLLNLKKILKYDRIEH